MELFVFICAAAMVIAGALGVVLRSNPVHAALSLVLTLFGIAVMFVSQQAEFLAAVQVVVYAGAIVVLFLFVIMLLGVDRAENLETEPLGIQRPLAIILSLGFVALLVTTILQGRDSLNMRQIARSIFSDYVVAFEVTSVLLIVAVVGTVVLARKRKSEKDLTGVSA